MLGVNQQPPTQQCLFDIRCTNLVGCYHATKFRGAWLFVLYKMVCRQATSSPVAPPGRFCSFILSERTITSRNGLAWGRFGSCRTGMFHLLHANCECQGGSC